MANKNLKVALQVQADLNQAKREIGSLKAEIKDTSKVADAATASQAKTSKAVAVTADDRTFYFYDTSIIFFNCNISNI